MRVGTLLGVAFCMAGCGTLIGLGDEAAVLSSQDGGATGQSDAGMCGTKPFSNVVCNTCSETYCCAERIACSQDPDCVRIATCTVDCAYEIRCINACGTNPTYEAMQACVLRGCTKECLPGAECQKLSVCCSSLAPSPLQVACRGQVNRGDEQACTDELKITIQGQGFCEPGATDAGPSTDAKPE